MFKGVIVIVNFFLIHNVLYCLRPGSHIVVEPRHDAVEREPNMCEHISGGCI